MTVNLNLIQRGLKHLDQAANCFEDGGLRFAYKEVDELYTMVQAYLDTCLEKVEDIEEEQEKGEDDVQE